MTYDRDIRWMRRVMLLLTVFNVGSVIGGLYYHRWVDAIAGALWALNCFVVLGTLAISQKSRDRGREIEAAVLQVLIEEE